MVARIAAGLRAVWNGVREWSGDAAYEIYLRSEERRGCRATLSREEFYVEQLKRKYSRVSRCC
jgi:hypothetical protein